MKSAEWTNFEPAPSTEKLNENVVETAYGDRISLSLAIIPSSPQNPSCGQYTIALVNDSNYFLSFCIFSLDQERNSLLSKGVVEPNISLDLAFLELDDLISLNGIRIQAFAFKINKLFECQPIIDRSVYFNADLLRKSSAFSPGIYFDNPVKEIALFKDGQQVIDNKIDAEMLLKAFSSDLNSKSRKRKLKINPNRILDPIEVDLHIHELIDSTAGMDNYAMLQLQLDEVRKTMNLHSKRIGQKLIFIHGKGDGVLRKEVRKLLSKEFPACDVQDASFHKYGFGATSVLIRRNQSPT